MQLSLICGSSPRATGYGLLTMTFVAFTGFYLWNWTFPSAPVSDMPLTAATAFLENLAAGQFEAAYARTSADFQSEHSVDSFRAMLDQSPCFPEAPYGGGPEGHDGPVTLCILDSTSQDCLIEAVYDNARVFLKLTVDPDQWKISTCIVQANVLK